MAAQKSKISHAEALLQQTANEIRKIETTLQDIKKQLGNNNLGATTKTNLIDNEVTLQNQLKKLYQDRNIYQQTINNMKKRNSEVPTWSDTFGTIRSYMPMGLTIH